MPDFISNAYSKGLLGEQTAEQYLCSKGMTLIERRYRSPYGEIDLLMMDGEVLVFAEVKARTSRSIYEAQLAVTPTKQKRIVQTALWFLAAHPEFAQHPMRFDVVALSGDTVHHIINAFQGSGW